MTIRSNAIPLPIDNVDTDQIIPARFLKKTDRAGFGKHLFSNWRYNAEGREDQTFIMNQEVRKDAEIIVAGNNFGCGSSREHAAWALADYGIRAVISTQFADIFKGNALNNGILPIELPEKAVQSMLEATTNDSAAEIVIDLEAQTATLPAKELTCSFEIDPFKKECVQKGIDETDYLLEHLLEVINYEQRKYSS